MSSAEHKKQNNYRLCSFRGFTFNGHHGARASKYKAIALFGLVETEEIAMEQWNVNEDNL